MSNTSCNVEQVEDSVLLPFKHVAWYRMVGRLLGASVNLEAHIHIGESSSS